MPQCCRTRCRLFFRAQPGQSITELALVIPVLMVILLGTIDLGRAFYAYTAITNAAREGARYGMEHPAAGVGSAPGNCAGTGSTFWDVVCHELDGTGVVITNLTVECSPYDPLGGGSYAAAYCQNPFSGDRIRVTVSVDFDSVGTGFLPFGHLVMTNSATMAITHGLIP